MKNGPMAEFLGASRVLVENARGLPEISGVLAGFGYTAARLDEGARLWAEAREAVSAHAKEYGDQYGATEDVNRAWEAAKGAYTKTLKIARIALADDAKAAGALKLYGPRSQSLAGWLVQAATFYGNLTGDLGAQLAKYGYNSQKLAEEQALVTDVQTKSQIQSRETGEAQQATQDRDHKVAALDKWVSELKAVCKVAFDGNEQEMEKLGIVVLNRPRRKASRTSADA